MAMFNSYVSLPEAILQKTTPQGLPQGLRCLRRCQCFEERKHRLALTEDGRPEQKTTGDGTRIETSSRYKREYLMGYVNIICHYSNLVWEYITWYDGICGKAI